MISGEFRHSPSHLAPFRAYWRAVGRRSRQGGRCQSSTYLIKRILLNCQSYSLLMTAAATARRSQLLYRRPKSRPRVRKANPPPERLRCPATLTSHCLVYSLAFAAFVGSAFAWEWHLQESGIQSRPRGLPVQIVELQPKRKLVPGPNEKS